MRVPTLVVSSALVLGGCASVNVKKTCYGDGVCRVERNGVVSFEGPPTRSPHPRARPIPPPMPSARRRVDLPAGA